MATTSLGRLTLDLAVRLSDFTDGLTQAERQARDSASNISDSVSELRDNITDDISRISGSFAGMAIGGIAVAAGAIAALAVETAKADVQLGIMAGTANTSLESFQVLSYAAAGFGVEQEALGAIIADTQEKLGEFSATGGGGAADFFEALQNNTAMTDEEIRNLGKTLQGKDGVGAIQYLKDELDALGATSQEQRFIMESLAGDLGNLMPLFANGGDVLNRYGQELEAAGVIKTAEAIEQSRRLAAQTQAIQTQFEGLKTQLVASTIPAMSTLIEYFQEGSKKGRGFTNEVNGVGESVRVTTGLIIGLAASVSTIAQTFQAVSAQMRAIGQTTINFVEADGVVAKSKALIAGTITSAGLASVSMRSINDEYERAVRAFEASSNGQQNRLTGLAAVQYEANNFLQSHTSGLALNTVEKDANAKAADELAKKNDKAAKSIKELGSAYVSNTALSGLKLKSNEAIAGGKARGYTAEFAEITQSLVGDNLKYFSAINDTYHKGTSSKHASGQAFDVVLKDAKKAKEAVAQIKAAAKEYGYQVKILDEYANPSKNATGGHLHVSVYGQTDNGKGGADLAWLKQQNNEVQKAAQEAEKLKQETLKRQMSIQVKYATEREKIESDHAANVAEIKYLYAEGSANREIYLAREELDYIDKKNAKSKAILVKYLDGEAKLRYEHGLALKEIELASVEDDEARNELITRQKAAYAEDLENFRWAAGAKAREQDKMYQSLANSMKANGLSAAGTGLDAMAQRTMSGQDYEVWRLAQDHDEAYDSVNNQYADRQKEINEKDERGEEYLLPELERNELLELARQEHLDSMWAMEQEYALKEQTLTEEQASQRVAMYQSLFSGIAGLTKSFAGEQSAAYRISFAIEKGFAIAQSVMAIQQAVAKAMAVGFPANIPLIAQSVAQGAQVISSIKNVQAPAVSGIAHGGLDYVPKESTYLLDKGERVLSPRQNKDLANFMSNGQKASAGNITINNNSSAQVSASRGPNGEVTIEMVDKMMDKRFRNIGRANSLESKAIQRGTTARVNRR